jgi:hypothetical protein
MGVRLFWAKFKNYSVEFLLNKNVFDSLSLPDILSFSKNVSRIKGASNN